MGHSEAGAQKRSKNTPWGTFWPGPLGTPVNGGQGRNLMVSNMHKKQRPFKIGSTQHARASVCSCFPQALGEDALDSHAAIQCRGVDDILQEDTDGLGQASTGGKQTGGNDICVTTGRTVRCRTNRKRRHCTGKRLSRAIW